MSGESASTTPTTPTIDSSAARPNVGGQAVIEGVMMRSPKSFAVVCRLPDGKIVIKEEEWRPVWGKAKVLRLPFLRGGVVLLESLVNGVSALTFSANQQMEAEERIAKQAESEQAAAQEPGVPEAIAVEKKPEKPFKSLGARSADQPEESSHFGTIGMVAVSLVFGLALFVGAPHLAAWGLGEVLGFDASSFIFHAVDGLIKLAILIGYLAAISLLPDVRRVFQYHGAEHKAIFTYENHLPLTVENARKQTRFHPRCGTSFLLIVIMVSVALFSALLTYRLAESTVLDHLLKIGIKIPLMFPIAGIAYEFIRLAGKKCDTSLTARIMSAPGMWLQKITTREPDDDQLEIALISIRKTLWREKLGADAPAIGHKGIEVFASAAEIELPTAV